VFPATATACRITGPANDRFTILENGFGSGLNFLTTWAAWRADRERARKPCITSPPKCIRSRLPIW
jgi:tRNA U34 5-methylaminomethyl-2-thiouridine-forming methyltransferase MnmC